MGLKSFFQKRLGGNTWAVKGISTSAFTMVSGKVGFANMNELGVQQIATSRQIRDVFGQQKNICRQIEDNLNDMTTLISHYDRELASGALVQQMDVIAQDISRFVNYVNESLSVLKKFRLDFSNLVEADKKNRNLAEIIRALKDDLALLKSALEKEIKVEKDQVKVREMLSDEDRTRHENNLTTVVNKIRAVEGKMSDIEAELRVRIEQANADIAARRAEKKDAGRLSALGSDLVNMIDDLGVLFRQMGETAMRPRLKPEMVSFRVTDDINKIFDLVIQNQVLIGTLIERQKFYFVKGAYVGMDVKPVIQKMEPANNQVLKRVEGLYGKSLQSEIAPLTAKGANPPLRRA